MVTPGLLPESELKEHLKELTHEQRQVVLKEQELYRARVMIRRQSRHSGVRCGAWVGGRACGRAGGRTGAGTCLPACVF